MTAEGLSLGMARNREPDLGAGRIAESAAQRRAAG